MAWSGQSGWSGRACVLCWSWEGKCPLAAPGPCRVPRHLHSRPATVRGCGDVMPILERSQPAARSSCWGCFLPCLLLSSAWPHIPSSPSMPRSGAIAFPRFEFAIDQGARALDPGPWGLGTWVPVPSVPVPVPVPTALCPVPCGRARPHGPETLNTGQGNIQSLMSQTGYYSLDGGVWRFQGTPRYPLEHMGRLTLRLVYQCIHTEQ